MKNCRILKLILDLSLDKCKCEMKKSVLKPASCGAFLCLTDGTCKNVDTSVPIFNQTHYYDLVMSVTDIILSIGNDNDLSDVLLASITKQPNWAKCFDRRHVSF